MQTDQKIIEKLLESHTETVVDVLEKWESKETAALIASLPLEQSLTLIAKMIPFYSARILQNLPIEKSIEIVNNLPTKISASILLKVEKDARIPVVEGVSKEVSQKLAPLLSYPKEAVGAHIDPNPLVVIIDQKVGEVLQMVKGDSNKVRSHLFVIDREQHLLGFVDLRDLIGSADEIEIQQLLKKVPKTLSMNMQIKQAMAHWDQSFSALPVVDTDGIFKGVVSKELSSSAESKSQRKADESLGEAGEALSELYLIGLSSLFGHNKKS